MCLGCEKGVGRFSGWNCPVRRSSQRCTVRHFPSHTPIQHLPLAMQNTPFTFLEIHFISFHIKLRHARSWRAISLLIQLDESPFVNGRITHRIKVVPTANLTVSCTVSNDFGMDTRTINVSSRKYRVLSRVLSPLLTLKRVNNLPLCMSSLLCPLTVCMPTLHGASPNLI